jgi:hypothetical protein
MSIQSTGLSHDERGGGQAGRNTKTLEPLAVSPRQACQLMNVGMTRLHQILKDPDEKLETYMEGGVRRITVASIRARVERRAAKGKPPESRPGRDVQDHIARLRPERLTEVVERRRTKKREPAAAEP